MFGSLGAMELGIMLPVMLVLWLLPVAAGIWALLTLSRISKALERIEQRLEQLTGALS